MSSRAPRNARIKGTDGVEPAPGDLGPEVHPRDLVIGEEYYYIGHPDSPVRNRSRWGKNLPHKYSKRVYTGTRPNMRETAYMKTKGSSGNGLYDWDLVPLVRMGSHGPGIFYKVLGPMTNDERAAKIKVLSDGGLPVESARHIVNYANVGRKPNNSTKKSSSSSSGGSSGGRRRRRRTKSSTRRRSRY
jgi:hypothetical protein